MFRYKAVTETTRSILGILNAMSRWQIKQLRCFDILNNLPETNATCAQTRLMHIYATDLANILHIAGHHRGSFIHLLRLHQGAALSVL